MNYKQFKTDFAGRELKVEIGKLAQQASGSVLVTYGQTSILATCVIDKDVRDIDYLPLSVEYEEKLYAAGKIKSGRFMKREGRASDEAILTGRMIDRTIRPCFNQGIRNDIQIVLTVLSFDKENAADIPALIGASLAVGLSGISWDGPIGGLRIARTLTAESGQKEKWVLNPTYKIGEQSDFNLVISGKQDRINMLEGGAKETSEQTLLSAMEYAQPHIKSIIEFQQKIIDEVNPEKLETGIQQIDEDIVKKIQDWLGDKLETAVYQPNQMDTYKELEIIEKELIADLVDESADDVENKKWQIKEVLDAEVGKTIKRNILKSDKRPDGRKFDQIRPLKCEIGLFPRTHGSGLFQRGETQALSVVTLGGPNEGQTIDNMEVDTVKNFMHHYNFPPFCTGETGRLGGPGRREIGHGALAEKALLPMIPSKEEFPYTIRIVSEILASNGSSSMASTCGCSLSLMDAGVPIKSPVAGIAMGIIKESDDNYKVLTDIAGVEDHHGGMDCKLAGTAKGVTAVQMDVKIDGATLEMFKQIFTQARKARLEILDQMNKAIDKPKPEMSPYAPRIISIKINPDKIRDVIGPGGKVINGIIDETGAQIDIEDDGSVHITSEEEQSGQKALEWIRNLTREVKSGEIFQGKVVKITDFGAFVEILPGQDGLLHISELSEQRVDRVEDILQLDQIIPVKVKDVNNGRISLTLKNIKS